MNPRYSMLQLKELYDAAYLQAKRVLGHFPKPKLVIDMDNRHKLGHFHYVGYPAYEIHVRATTREEPYRSFLHELVHSYIDYEDTHHRGQFAVLAAKVGASYNWVH